MNFGRKNITKGIKSTILGVALIGLAGYLAYQSAHNVDINDWYVVGSGISGLTLLFTPDTFIKILESIPSIIKKKFDKS